MYDDGQCRKPVLCFIASDVFRLQSSKYKKYDLVISASFFEIYSGKVVRSALSYLICFFYSTMSIWVLQILLSIIWLAHCLCLLPVKSPTKKSMGNVV